jgi:ABC-type microcin C transport system permease subunit YejE
MFNFNPQTQKKIRRFKEIKTGYYSFLILCTLLVSVLFAELWVNSRALVVSYEGELYFPSYTEFHPGTDFGLDYGYETSYRDLKLVFESEDSGNLRTIHQQISTNLKRQILKTNTILVQTRPVETFLRGSSMVRV